MAQDSYKTALIVGTGSGLSASLARLLARNGMKVALAARSVEWVGTQGYAVLAATGSADNHRIYRVLRNAIRALRSSADRSNPKGCPLTAYVFMP